MQPNGITIEREDAILAITLCRPPVNALDGEMAAAIDAALDEAGPASELRILVFRSNQKVFSAGGDIALMSRLFETEDGPGVFIETVVRPLQQLFHRVENAPFITVAEISGHALGGGLELALSCDYRIVADEAKLGLVEVHLGLLAAAGGTQRLTRLLGSAMAKRLIFRGETVFGRDAVALGLAQWSRPQADLQAFTDGIIKEVASLPKAALGASKHCIDAAMDPAVDGFEEEIIRSEHLYGDPETIRLIGEFLKKNRCG